MIDELSPTSDLRPVPRELLSNDAYRPLPTIVEAARELFETCELRYIKRARAAVFVPPMEALDETFEYLCASGFVVIDEGGGHQLVGQ